MNPNRSKRSLTRPARTLMATGLVLTSGLYVPPGIAQVPAGGQTTNAAPSTLPPNEDIQVSFQGANIDMIVQWLAQSTGKSVVKHPQAQCQITITSSKKLPPRDAINLVYRALSLEGFTAVESANSIFIVPEGKEPRMSPELLDAGRSDVPVGRQRLVKIFQLHFVQASEMKEKIKSVVSEKGTLEINERANQLILTDYNESVSLASDLIKVLDTDRPGDLAVRVIPLKHVSATDLVKEITPLYQKMSGKAQNEPIDVTANERSNSLIVLSSETNYKAIERIVTTLDTEDAQEKTMRLFPLKNADAEDVAKQLKELVADQENSGRSRYFYFEPQDNSRKGKKMSVVADRRRNTLIIQAPPSEIESIAKMVRALDEPVGGEALAPRIYPLKYVGAVDIEDVLNELFLKKTQQRSYYFFDDNLEPTADRDVGRLYGKVRITSEPYSNAIIVTANSLESLRAVEEVLKQLDAPSPAGESTFRTTLKYAKATDVANSLNILFAKVGSPGLRPIAQPGQPNQQQQQTQDQGAFDQSQNSTPLEREVKEDLYFPWLGGQPENQRTGDGKTATRQVSDLVGRVRVVPDHRSNSLMISANVHFFPQVLKLIEELDAPTPQVLIEARIVEVSSDLMDRYGVRWSPNGSTTFTADDYDSSISASTKGNYQKGFGGVNTVNNSSAANIGQQLAGLKSGVLDSTVSLDLLVQFLKRNTAASVLAEPQINIEDNETGKLFVGSQVPFINQTLTPQTGGLSQSFKYKEVGIILEVIPHINVTGTVALKIRIESSSIVPGQTLFGGAILDTRTFKTDMTASSGETLVLGGIMQKQISDTVRKVPLLGDIPGLGWAFKKKDKSSKDVELLVFLRPRVIRTSIDAQEALGEVKGKAPLVREFLQKNDMPGATNTPSRPKKR